MNKSHGMNACFLTVNFTQNTWLFFLKIYKYLAQFQTDF